MKISNADGVEFTEPVTVPEATADGHAINKGQADDAYAPIGRYPPFLGDVATSEQEPAQFQDVEDAWVAIMGRDSIHGDIAIATDSTGAYVPIMVLVRRLETGGLDQWDYLSANFYTIGL